MSPYPACSDWDLNLSAAIWRSLVLTRSVPCWKPCNLYCYLPPALWSSDSLWPSLSTGRPSRSPVSVPHCKGRGYLGKCFSQHDRRLTNLNFPIRFRSPRFWCISTFCICLSGRWGTNSSLLSWWRGTWAVLWRLVSAKKSKLVPTSENMIYVHLEFIFVQIIMVNVYNLN